MERSLDLEYMPNSVILPASKATIRSRGIADARGLWVKRSSVFKIAGNSLTECVQDCREFADRVCSRLQGIR